MRLSATSLETKDRFYEICAFLAVHHPGPCRAASGERFRTLVSVEGDLVLSGGATEGRCVGVGVLSPEGVDTPPATRQRSVLLD